MSGNSRTRRLAIVSTLIVLLASVLLAAIGGEIYVRLRSPYGYVTPELLRAERPLYSPALFARHVFPQEARRIVDQSGELAYLINDLGYRGESFIARKPADKIRIMVYGGSSVFDPYNLGTGDWPHRMETELRQAGFGAVEVINAGIPGHASYDAVGRLFAEGHLFDPDYVLFYGAWNDIKDFRSTESLLRSRLPMQQADEDSPIFNYQNFLDRWLSEFSQLYVRLRERYYTWSFRIGSEGVVPEGDYVSTLSETALRQYRMDIQTFVDVARNAGAVPVLVTEARLASQENTAAEIHRIQYEMVLLTQEALLRAFESTDRILYEVSMEKQVLLIDASSVLSGKDDLFVDAVHLTDRGASALANIVAAPLGTLLSKAPETAAGHFERDRE